MKLSEFDFDLPAELIAQQPAETRDASRMLVLDRRAGAWRDEVFNSFPSHFSEGDTIVVNNTRVFPARLEGAREGSGGKVELFLVREIEHDLRAPLWEVLARPGRRLQPGARVTFGDSALRAEVIERIDDAGRRLVRFDADDEFDTVIDRIGRTPLPPYIKRSDEEAELGDRARYQTVYAKERGAIAAPTAGLHLTSEVLDDLRTRGGRVVEITLHVGYGTFAPVRADDLKDHSVAAERFAISDDAARVINERRAAGGRTIAIGTTSVRALESAATGVGSVAVTEGFRATELTITPGYDFRVVDALLTNFHLPQSSLLVLSAAFAGRDLLLAAYAHAVQKRYRFYSYGDCMLIV